MNISFKTNVDEVTEEVKNWIVTRMTVGAEYREYSKEELEAKKDELKSRGIEMFLEEDNGKNHVINIGCRYIESKEPIVLYEITCDIDLKNKEITYKYEIVI